MPIPSTTRQVRGQARITIYDRFHEMQPNPSSDWLPLSRREVYTDKGDYYALFLNGKGYEVTYRGVAPQDEETMQRYRLAIRRDIFYFMRYRRNEDGLYYYYKGTEIVDNVPCETVDITDIEGEAIHPVYSQVRRITSPAAIPPTRSKIPHPF